MYIVITCMHIHVHVHSHVHVYMYLVTIYGSINYTEFICVYNPVLYTVYEYCNYYQLTMYIVHLCLFADDPGLEAMYREAWYPDDELDFVSVSCLLVYR